MKCSPVIFLTVLLVNAGCSLTPTALSDRAASELAAYAIANTDISCDMGFALDRVNFKRYSKFEPKDLSGEKYNVMFHMQEFPPGAIFINSNVFSPSLLYSHHGVVLNPGGNFLFSENHYAFFNIMNGRYTFPPGADCEVADKTQAPFSIIRN